MRCIVDILVFFRVNVTHGEREREKFIRRHKCRTYSGGLATLDIQISKIYFELDGCYSVILHSSGESAR